MPLSLLSLLIGSLTWGAIVVGLVAAAFLVMALLRYPEASRILAMVSVVCFFATSIPFVYGLFTAFRGRRQGPLWSSCLGLAVNAGGLLTLFGVLLVILNDGVRPPAP